MFTCSAGRDEIAHVAGVVKNHVFRHGVAAIHIGNTVVTKAVHRAVEQCLAIINALCNKSNDSIRGLDKLK